MFKLDNNPPIDGKILATESSITVFYDNACICFEYITSNNACICFEYFISIGSLHCSLLIAIFVISSISQLPMMVENFFAKLFVVQGEGGKDKTVWDNCELPRLTKIKFVHRLTFFATIFVVFVIFFMNI